MNNKKLLELAKEASLLAGEKIIKIYNTGDFGVEAKSDNSPLTLADKAAHQVIMQYLAQTPYPILSEEGKRVDYNTRKNWEIFWMVDPLDGTKEFVKKNGEFTVNIALIKHNKPVLGVVYAPVLGKLYYADQENGAFLEFEDNTQALQVNKQTQTKIRIVASKSHLNDDTRAFITQYENYELISMGSSLKFMLIAEGGADIYPRLAPTMEWDTAAAQVIVEASGGRVLNFESKKTITYNKENLLNPYFVVHA